ncbi:hypothetical protein [Rhodococcus rhodnii]|uniref:Uncharacterized protein n=1 Tax=Rhodococcus rhodnii LMG 5362 TaxID=1273125 RepID=R7WP57_9NOCA|nr:hypothetical protein [Rhodococcus rhodnii]EOM75759.1 hypothetical protein Rrhod_2901 [Rhodococcus rhodnii LMG 5362]
MRLPETPDEVTDRDVAVLAEILGPDHAIVRLPHVADEWCARDETAIVRRTHDDRVAVRTIDTLSTAQAVDFAAAIVAIAKRIVTDATTAGR